MRGGPRAIDADDLAVAAAVAESGRSRAELQAPTVAAPRCRLWSRRAVVLSEVLPLLDRLGVSVTDERAYVIDAGGDAPVSVVLSDLGLRPLVATPEPSVAATWEQAVAAVWDGEAVDDGLNRLVLAGGLTLRDVQVVRAYAHWIRQALVPHSLATIERTLVEHAELTAAMVRLFDCRFDPARSAAGIPPQLLAQLRTGIDAVERLDHDRILRAVLASIQATVRTNAFRTDDPLDLGPRRRGLALKFDPSQLSDLPLPRPFREVWVSGRDVQGVHLRGGPVARGGLRASDRADDLRTEILGLMRTQMAKNTVIVPVGAKGGFVLTAPPEEPASRANAVREAYRTFVAALLDVTDSLAGDVVVPPPGVVRHDGDDPYLVVAADKGTAALSDEGNAIATRYGFWLGDAFASGGSTGYDHKALGITARGAWESVRAHGRHLGVDPDTETLTVVGIGDLSGDVFGNGMLRSDALRLVAAFDHRHVFLDPDPDPVAAATERRRMVALPRSSWLDYDPDAISPGGGVWPRSAKSIPLSERVRQVLQVDVEELTPDELVRAILRAPVDLLWNGGIGTFVKASEETDDEVGDHANDSVRIQGRELRCRMVAEGGNLGFTQRARVEYSLAGGLINTDAIDNSAGVDCSDHEVNLKILLDAAVHAGRLDRSSRNRLLADLTDEVAETVLDDNRAQVTALAVARRQAGPMAAVHARQLAARAPQLAGHALPDDAELARRARSGAGLTSPEFAVLLADVKSSATVEVLASTLPDDPAALPALHAYFPARAVDIARAQLPSHRLRREIVATRLVNDLVNRMGVSFLFRLGEETGCTTAEIVRAHLAAATVFDLPARWNATADSDGPEALRLEALLRLRRLVERSTRWLLREEGPELDVDAVSTRYRPAALELEAALPAILARNEASMHPSDLLHLALPAARLSASTRRPVRDLWGTAAVVVERLDLAWLVDAVWKLPRATRWEALARIQLRDELTDAVLGLAVATGSLSPDPADPAWLGWLERNRRGVSRLDQVRGLLDRGDRAGLAALSVAVRSLSRLAGAR